MWVQALFHLSPHASLSVATGPHKEIGVGVSGSMDGSSAGMDLRSPWGWMADFTVAWMADRNFGISAGIRYTRVRYAAGASNLDASSVGVGNVLLMYP